MKQFFHFQKNPKERWKLNKEHFQNLNFFEQIILFSIKIVYDCWATFSFQFAEFVRQRKTFFRHKN